MRTLVKTVLLLTSLVLGACESHPSICTGSKIGLTQTTGISKDQAIDLARQKGREMNIPVDERIPQVKEEGTCFVVEYPPPANALSGAWIFRVDKTNGKIVDTKIWR